MDFSQTCSAYDSSLTVRAEIPLRERPQDVCPARRHPSEPGRLHQGGVEVDGLDVGADDAAGTDAQGFGESVWISEIKGPLFSRQLIRWYS